MVIVGSITGNTNTLAGNVPPKVRSIHALSHAQPAAA
jgi:hypothetical protein